MDSSSSPSLPENIVEVLEGTLEEFRKAGQKERKAIIKTSAKDTLPDGGNMQKHKNVSPLYVSFMVHQIMIQTHRW
jgi:hypothetical protein